ncbi:MAG: LacI family DNA-binding transcriptional regulator [Chloroflexi bacterium]|nr:LacI family DNA-binding transcriptional regulator [Chloroflexota bacterium]
MVRGPIRIVDIAERVGVSISAVSAVLNNKAEEARISPQVQQRVWAAARELGYQPNIAARRLRAGGHGDQSTYLAIATSLETSMELLGKVVRGVQQFAAASADPIQITIETFRRGHVDKLPGLLDGTRFNGAIIANTAPEDDEFLATAAIPVPLIVFLREVSGQNCVSSRARAAGAQAASLFMSAGRQHPAVLVPADQTQVRLERQEGYIQAFRDADFPTARIAEIVSDAFSEEMGYRAMERFLATGGQCDALFAVGDIMAFGAVAAIKAAGLHIPEDIAVIGHDDLEMARFIDPPLTTFRLPLIDMARDAAAMVVEMLHQHHHATTHRVYDAELTVRAST